MIRKLIFAAWILILTFDVNACTTAIISGKCTPDGRPILWKHRDSGAFENKLMYFNDGAYPYIGLINSNDSLGSEVWAGSNSAGFSIMNSASYNLIIGEDPERKDEEGIFMKRALQQCATLEDFEQLLNETAGDRGIEANFGVIDAHGGAAYYETDHHHYFKIDADDPAAAPFGYIIRTNYSFSGKIDTGYGFIRYQTAADLFYQAVAENKLSLQFVITEADRNIYQSLTKTDLRKPPLPVSKDHTKYVSFEDYINRYTSVSTMIVHGVMPGESPDLTTIWTIPGFPLCSVAVPAWVAAGSKLPSELTAPGAENSPLCAKALQLKNRSFPIQRGSGKKYLNLSELLNQQGDGILQMLPAIENKIIIRTEPFLIKWRSDGFNKKEAQTLYDILDQMIKSEFNKHFGF